ncbi:Hypothetical_protein [Hexamita inflata]|uniref:Hypothetical_protein n=1 Tax=Hexamita inflata TaxID=28002 RepID=A0AA86NND9_9EUKA|nr:Hypothetical protein HINF_LOCUS10303 [Hexamita inflata]
MLSIENTIKITKDINWINYYRLCYSPAFQRLRRRLSHHSQMLFVSLLAQPCYIYLEAEFDDGKFSVEFKSGCHQTGAPLQVTLTPNIYGAPALVFTKTVAVEDKGEVDVDFTCADTAPYNPSCDAILDALRTNITGTIVISDLADPLANPAETFQNVFIDVDYNADELTSQQIGIIVGCSVASVGLIIVIICVACHVSKKRAAKKLPLLDTYHIHQPPVQQLGVMPMMVNIPIGSL